MVNIKTDSRKVKKEDAIEVSKIVFVSPTLTEKLIKKKINNKISRLLLELNTTYDDEAATSPFLLSLLIK